MSECILDTLDSLQRDEDFRLKFIGSNPDCYTELMRLNFPFYVMSGLASTYLTVWLSEVSYDILESLFNLPFIN
jgi:hypothetical protein